MLKNQKKYIWLVKNLRNFIVACIRVFLHCIRHPEKLYNLSFSFFSDINEFYQSSHGKLYHFEDTKLFHKLKNSMVLAKCNFFNLDLRVSRPNEVQILSALVSYLKPQNLFEIGTYNGYTTLHLASNSSLNSTVYTLDLPPDFEIDLQNQEQLSKYSYDDILVAELSKKNVLNRMYKNSEYKRKIIEIFGDSKSYDFSPYYGKMDFIFIDGNHSYEYVKSDTENAFKMLSENGVIVWHDFDYIIHRDIFKYLNTLVKDFKIYSIAHTRFAIYGPCLENNSF
jgi:predicted O-methyltransferase YrrM